MPGLSMGTISSSYEKGEAVRYLLLRTLFVNNVNIAGLEAYQGSQSKVHFAWMMWAFGNEGCWRQQV